MTTSSADDMKAVLVELKTLNTLLAAIGAGQILEGDEPEQLREDAAAAA